VADSLPGLTVNAHSSGAPLAEVPAALAPASVEAGAPEPGAAPFSSCAFAIDNSAATAASAASMERFMIPLRFSAV